MKKKQKRVGRNGKTPKLGQHFLRDMSVIQKAVQAARLSKKDTVLEIGPGKGVLTRALLKEAKRVIAVEKDPRLFEELTRTFAHEIEEKKLTLLCEDIRTFALSRYKVQGTGYKVVANIPYYLTGEILRLFLSGENQPELMVLLVQKEVAERIVAKDKKESILSLSVKVYGEPKIIAQVKAGAFSPPPKIDSALLLIDRISRARFRARADEDRFFTLVKAGFAQKRKTLKGNLTKAGFIHEAGNTSIYIRAEELSCKEWCHFLGAFYGPIETPSCEGNQRVPKVKIGTQNGGTGIKTTHTPPG